jgi:hypothetical protein
VIGTPCVGRDGVSQCPNFDFDGLNCGSCNHVCGDGESCQNGKCIPQDCGGSTFCGNSGCVDTSNDPAHCGGCNKGCMGGAAFDYTAYTCTNGACRCAPLANPCGKGCASDFWYCPAPDFQGSAADLCTQSSRNSYERCACKGCLAEVQACSGSTTCVNSMDCTLRSLCVGCTPTFPSCGDTSQGAVDPLADKLTACLNAQCASP